MENVVPPSILFDFRLPIPLCRNPSTKSAGRLLDLEKSSPLFLPSAVNGGTAFADVTMGWNESGLALQLGVTGKASLPQGWASRIDTSDHWTIWVDTRPSGNVHKATEYCHCFSFLPADLDNKGIPLTIVQPIAQQRATRIESSPEKFQLRVHTDDTGYQMEIWIPGSQLYGYREISELGRIGFYCVVNDIKLGEQHFGVGEDFPTSYDPSTWTQLELTK